MKFMLIAASLLFSLNSYAAKLWTDISVRDFVYLTSELKIQNSDVIFEKSAKMIVLEISPMPVINVFLYRVKADICPSATSTSELEMYNVRQRRGTTTIGIELLKKCEMEIYVEKTDLGTLSLFN